MVNKIFYILIATLLLVLASCARKHDLNYNEASALFSKGLNYNQVIELCGEPLGRDSNGDQEMWFYKNGKKIMTGSEKEFSGFIITFQGGLSVKIDPLITTKK